MSGTTEHDIFANMPGFGAASDTETTTSEPTTDTTTTAATTTDNSADTNQQTSNVTGTDNVNKGTDKQVPDVKARKHDGLIEKPNETNPNTRDLVDPVTGRVVAKGGIERRVFENAQRESRRATELEGKLAEANQRLSSVDTVNRSIVDAGLRTEDAIAAISVMRDFLRDPVKTLEFLVAEVKSKGYQIPFLEQGINPGIDMSAIGKMIDGKLAPLTQQQQREVEDINRQKKADELANRQLDEFLTARPAAEHNLDVMAEMMRAEPGLTLHDAYLNMAEWCVKNGLDYTQPLRPQIEALKAQPQQQPTIQQPTNQPANSQNNSPPLPGPRSNNQPAAPTTEVGTYNENASWKEILGAEMRANGYQV